MIKKIMFDWNGTLLDDVDVSMSAMNQLLLKRNMPPLKDKAAYQRIFDFPVSRYYQRLGFDFQQDSFEELSVEFIDWYTRLEKACSLMPSAAELICRLHQAQIGCGILSASKRENLIQQLRDRNCLDWFDDIVGISDIYAASKVAAGKKWLAGQPLLKEEILMIGDTLHDAECARALGMDCLLVACGHQSYETLLSSGFPVLNDLSEVIELLKL